MKNFYEIFIPALLITAGGYGTMITMCKLIAYTVTM